MDKVIFDKLGNKFQSVKYKFKEKLLKRAKNESKKLGKRRPFMSRMKKIIRGTTSPSS